MRAARAQRRWSLGRPRGPQHRQPSAARADRARRRQSEPGHVAQARRRARHHADRARGRRTGDRAGRRRGGAGRDDAVVHPRREAPRGCWSATARSSCGPGRSGPATVATATRTALDRIELIAVETGTVALDVGHHRAEVPAGDSAWFDATLPHGYANPDSAPAPPSPSSSSSPHERPQLNRRPRLPRSRGGANAAPLNTTAKGTLSGAPSTSAELVRRTGVQASGEESLVGRSRLVAGDHRLWAPSRPLEVRHAAWSGGGDRRREARRRVARSRRLGTTPGVLVRRGG